MQWFRSRHVQFLEEERSRLLRENASLKAYANQLVERLLLKEGVPRVTLPSEATPQAIDKMLSGMDIFADVDELPTQDEIIDNRKEKLDEFVS